MRKSMEPRSDSKRPESRTLMVELGTSWVAGGPLVLGVPRV